MVTGDKPAILDMLNRIPEFRPGEVVVAEEVIDSYLNAPTGSGYNILVGEIDSSVVGYVCYGPTPLTEGTWDLYWIAVSPDVQGKHIGERLLTSAEDEIKKAGGRLLLVETSSKAEYTRTRHFYRSRGYKVICQIPDFYAPADDKLIFRKPLY
jgi:ribosomal protein S18 acetylase RimI-like enzyme